MASHNEGQMQVMGELEILWQVEGQLASSTKGQKYSAMPTTEEWV